jgi:hypothetical protein
MSGGHFEYKQYELNYIADEIEQIILTNSSNEYYNYSNETLEEFKRGLNIIREAAIYAQRIDWLISGDDGEDNFHSRLKKELAVLNATQKEKK